MRLTVQTAMLDRFTCVVAGNGQLAVVDISDPTDPKLLGRVVSEWLDEVFHLFIEGNYAYINFPILVRRGAEQSIIDLSVRDAPTILVEVVSDSCQPRLKL